MNPLRSLLSRYTKHVPGRNRTRRNRPGRRLTLELLEDRTVPTAVAPPSGLVSWWTGDGTAADLMTRNNATMFNGVTFAPGMVGQAFSFDGVDDRVQVTDSESESLKLTASLTIEAWVLVDSFPTAPAVSGHIIHRGDDRGGLDPYQLCVTAEGFLEFRIDSVDVRVILNAPIVLGQLIHVAATLDDATGAMRLYENGTMVAERFTTIRPFRDLDPASNPSIGIGNHGGYPTTPHKMFFDGLIDELSLYNRALTAEEVQSIYNAGSDGKIRMVVAKTNPDLGTTVTTPPTSFVVDFSYAYDPASVQAGDFTVNGIAATSVTLTDADTATFTFATSPVTAEGVQAMHMDAGAVIRSGDGLALAVYDGQFTYDRTTKFYVVDDSTANTTYEYHRSGAALESYSLAPANTAPRGAASNLAGDRVWVVDANKKVYVYDTNGSLLGSWTAGSLHAQAQLEGIATNGTDIWLLDNKTDKVFKYAGAATLLTGSQSAASSFSLNSGNKNAKGIVTDGVHFWVVNDASTDRVFKYTLTGALVGSWTIGAANASPTGITLDPANVAHLWIVDNGTDRVYQYDNAAGRTSGSQSPSTSFALAPGNTNPQDIADPPALDGTRMPLSTDFAGSAAGKGEPLAHASASASADAALVTALKRRKQELSALTDAVFADGVGLLLG
jgi:hypothetical protein